MDTRDIMLRIVGKQVSRGQEESDIIEFVTEGKLYQKGETVYLQYDEGEMSGMEGCRTMLRINKDKIRMKRFGGDVSLDTTIEFQKGKKFTGFYDTPFGPLEMEVLTNSINNNIDKENAKGSLDIDYHMSLRGLSDGRSRLNIEIM